MSSRRPCWVATERTWTASPITVPGQGKASSSSSKAHSNPTSSSSSPLASVVISAISSSRSRALGPRATRASSHQASAIASPATARSVSPLWRCPCWWHPGLAVEQLDEHVELPDPVLVGRVDVAADDAERLGAGEGSEAATDLLLQLDHAQVPLRLVVRRRHGDLGPVAGHLGTLVLEADEQVVGVPVG